MPGQFFLLLTVVLVSDHFNSQRRVPLNFSLFFMLNLPRRSLVVPFATNRPGPHEPFSSHTGSLVLLLPTALFMPFIVHPPCLLPQTRPWGTLLGPSNLLSPQRQCDSTRRKERGNQSF